MKKKAIYEKHKIQESMKKEDLLLGIPSLRHFSLTNNFLLS